MYALCLWEACQEWDDLEDEGKANHNALLSWLAFGRDEDRFYRAHSHLLRPAALLVYLQWTAANVLDHGDKNDVAKSYMLRAAIYSNFHLIAWICGGDHGRGLRILCQRDRYHDVTAERKVNTLSYTHC